MPFSRPGWNHLLWLAAYLVFAAALLAALVHLRRSAMAELDNPRARRQWQQWRDETRRQSEAAGPVQRRAVKTDEPPGLILLREHFPLIVITTLLIGSFVFVFLMWLLRGITRSGQTR